jgi:hypothetical protein
MQAPGTGVSETTRVACQHSRGARGRREEDGGAALQTPMRKCPLSQGSGSASSSSEVKLLRLGCHLRFAHILNPARAQASLAEAGCSPHSTLSLPSPFSPPSSPPYKGVRLGGRECGEVLSMSGP